MMTAPRRPERSDGLLGNSVESGLDRQLGNLTQARRIRLRRTVIYRLITGLPHIFIKL